MKNITLTDDTGTIITGQIPQGWHEVPLSQWLQFDLLKEGKPAGLDVAMLVSSLTSLPSEILMDDVSLVPIIFNQMKWLTAMPAPKPALCFNHLNTAYEHVGNLDKVSMAQFEALHSFLEQAGDSYIQAAPDLLAVLYKPKGRAQDLDTIRESSEAFRSLSMDKAWSAIAFFLTSSEPYATRIQSYSQSRKKMLQVMTLTERALATTHSRKLSLRTAVWLGRIYIRYARRLLLTF
ncbi:hypothetical protein [Pontibacter sp. SGAir0037]|uniref:hypothetical protein n=1 Tax=Pontibacter sp. SGAir0037 TaxID=2571030 RepID=UPI0010CD09A5|nr:hypothetical protein [Pontibacter sp. SGAir0037]QCR23778.1 hypothetical protein C1N53_16430 [Pontibacter sp. SGAir0037]